MKNTKLVTLGRDKQRTGKMVNPVVARTSTVVFDTVEELEKTAAQQHQYVDYYGRRGTSTTFAFRETMTELDGAAGCYVYPCGLAAITSAILSFVNSGDHILIVDSVYYPVRHFAATTLKRMNVEASYYDPLVGADIEQQIQSNTKVIFMESPGSLTMEIQDVPAITEVAKKHGIVTMIDNTFATPLNFKPLDFGVDVSIQSATKYINGHSDVMLGIVTANQQYWDTLQKHSYELGQCASVDDVYTALRGVRTLGVRLDKHAENARIVAKWLAQHPAVDHVRHPECETCPGHEFYKRDFTGSNGLFSFVMKQNSTAGYQAMLDNMQHFKMGFSWGGYESLILGVTDFSNQRTAVPWQYDAPLFRLHIGLEDTQDLIDDLDAGLARYQAHC